MNGEIRLILAVLAVFRVAELLAIDEGPGGVFQRIRDAMGASPGESGPPDTKLGRFAVCPWCWGVWLALGAAALVIWPSRAGDAGLVFMGIAGGQAVLQGLAGREWKG